MKNILKSILLFTIVSFAMQGTSHFILFKDHYASISFMRKDPILIGGLTAMVIQGGILGWLYTKMEDVKGWLFGLSMGVFFVIYIALVEPHKYEVPSRLEWFAIEGFVGMTQFILFGTALGFFIKKENEL
ncbi:MAG: hypothetical protein KDK36_14780 [Leptospiraceae bacterium]|nr:hypothetical protein [Leptospiraceae bacterium]